MTQDDDGIRGSESEPSDERHLEMTKRLGVFVRSRREWMGITQKEAARRSGLSESQWRVIERGTGESYRSLTLTQVDKVLGWPAQTSMKVLAGDMPPEAKGEAPPPGATSATGADLLADLSAEELSLVRAYVAGLRANRST